MPNVKDGVVFWPGMHSKIEGIMEKLDRLHITVGAERPTFITSARDSKHKESSKHYDGRAIDIRTNDLKRSVKYALEAAIKNTLGDEYFVDLEYEGQPHEHIHIQYNGPVE